VLTFDQGQPMPLPDVALEKAQRYVRALRRAVLAYWYATLEDPEAAALEAITATLYVNILDEAVFERALETRYRTIRSQDRLGRVVTGLELIRNCETHSSILAEDLLVQKQILGVPLHQGGQITRCVYAWAEYDQLPDDYRNLPSGTGDRQRRARGEAQDGYRKAVQGRHVIEALLDAMAFFESLDPRLIGVDGPPLQWAYGEAYGELPVGENPDGSVQAWLVARPMSLDRFELFLPDIVCRYTERRSARWPAADVTLGERRRLLRDQLPGETERQVAHALYEDGRLIGYSGYGSGGGSLRSSWVERKQQVWRDVRSGYRYYVRHDDGEVDLTVGGHERVVALQPDGNDLIALLPPAPPLSGLSSERLHMVEEYDDMYLEMRQTGLH
jgi:hypothetical protein